MYDLGVSQNFWNSLFSLVSSQYLVYIRAHRPQTWKKKANYLVYSITSHPIAVCCVRKRRVEQTAFYVDGLSGVS